MTGYCGTCAVSFTSIDGWVEHQHPLPARYLLPRRIQQEQRDSRVESLVREVVAWNDEDGLSAEEVASAMQISLTGAKQALLRLKAAGRVHAIGRWPARWFPA